MSPAVPDQPRIPATLRAMKGGAKTGPSPVDRGKTQQQAPRQRPDIVYADRGYDHDKYRRQVCDDMHEAFVALGCAIVCRRRLRNLLHEVSSTLTSGRSS